MSLEIINAIAGTLIPRREDIDHDWTTLTLYPEHVAIECTCGYHAPPPGLCERPEHHIDECLFKTNRLRDADKLTQPLLVKAAHRG